MVNWNDTIGTIKTYIQEERGIAFKQQRILSQDGEETMNVYKVPFIRKRTCCMRIKPGDTVGEKRLVFL
ncbi:hypothetical protein MTR67_049140 [Solanum verrucosum]|uniref:Ubiquitin-like domain-containing protein n=1 Tax=Solanum verrucosum TaxID=315347 RepID=A0AAF0V0V0_SOLVR|nr:hypothetical protein MTR67_049140 [Solanum verrucosum]